MTPSWTLDEVLAGIASLDRREGPSAPLPAWAIGWDSNEGRFVLMEPARLLAELAQRSVDLRTLQADLLAWATATYGPQTLERRGLVIGEETGEIMRAIVKAAEGVRPSTRGVLGTELAQLMVAILATAELAGVDMATELPKVIAELKSRVVERDPGRADV